MRYVGRLSRTSDVAFSLESCHNAGPIVRRSTLRLRAVLTMSRAAERGTPNARATPLPGLEVRGFHLEEPYPGKWRRRDWCQASRQLNASIASDTIRAMAEDTKPPGGEIDRSVADYLGKAEVAIYHIVGVLLAVTAVAAIVSAGRLLWTGFARWTLATETLRVLDQLLIVLMVVEILHTVRISIRSHIFLAMEPFLVVGLIASIRRVLIISLEMTTLAREGGWSPEGASFFKASMIELALLVVLIPVLVFSITLLRRHTPKEIIESLK